MDDIGKIKERIKELLWSGIRIESVDEAADGADELLSSLVPGDSAGTFFWPDINYDDDTRTTWDPAIHYRRILHILHCKGKQALTDDSILKKLLGALEYFAANDFMSDNWWHNQIGTPRNIADIALILDGFIPAPLSKKLEKIIERGSLSSNIPEEVLTGANCIWFCAITLRFAVLTDNEPLLRASCERAALELRYAPEGVQTDGSFFQHGPRLYSGGYGRAFIYDISQFIYVLSGTEYQFSREQLAVLANHVLDGLRYMTHNGMLDYQCLGREYSRPGTQAPGYLKRAIALLADTDGIERSDEYKSYRAMLTRSAPFGGTKYFPVAAYLCHHTGSLYVGAKFLHDGLLDEEICNAEGVLGYNLSYGTHHAAMVSGKEYFDISPVWQYDRIPGTTARNESDEVLLSRTEWHWRNIPRGGGDQNGDIAVIYEEMSHETVSGLVADFAFPGGFVSMNAALADSENAPLHTTLDQCFSTEPPVSDASGILHHGIRYTALDKSILKPEIKTVTGSWKRNNLTSSDAPVTATLFSLTVDFPDGHGSCAYMLSPADAPAPAVTLLRNDADCQALMLADSRVLAVFYKDTQLTLPDGTVINGTLGTYLDEKRAVKDRK